MDDSQNRHHIVFRQVDNPIASVHQFPKVWPPILGYNPTSPRNSVELFGGFNYPINEVNGVKDRIAGYKCFNFLEIVTRG